MVDTTYNPLGVLLSKDVDGIQRIHRLLSAGRSGFEQGLTFG